MFAQTAYAPASALSSRDADDLIQGHLEPLFRFVNFFLEDGAAALRLTDRVFRVAMEERSFSVPALYRAACEGLRTLPGASGAVGGLAREHALCWLLKDLAGLRYAEIASLLELDPSQVRAHIASARGTLLATA